MINYDNRVFRCVAASQNGEVNNETIFYYRHEGDTVTATFKGGPILDGRLTATIDEMGNLDIRYQYVNRHGEFMTGICYSTPEILPNGKIRLHEKWQWTSGNYRKGESVVEEI